MPFSDILLPVFVTLFVVIDPIGLTPVFVSLTAGVDGATRRKIAFQACAIAAVILVLFAVAGKHLLLLMGITLPAFRIAGGIMLFLIAVEMLFEKRTERRNRNATETTEPGHVESGAGDIAVFPLATPLIAGPGAAASIILLMGQHQGDLISQAVILAV
ncbi:MAG TPA: MarC family protein, partial [Rhizobiales bacterium]|nr:MarC family protein [Hyphomicrobiales bacterium]